ncbi:MAG: transposase [Promethearchaeota archaeon]
MPSYPLMTGKCFVQFMKGLTKRYIHAEKLYIIPDNAPAHRSRIATESINTINKGTRKPKVQLIYLPPYSPELNEIEQVWRVIKSHVVYNTYYPEADEFRTA